MHGAPLQEPQMNRGITAPRLPVTILHSTVQNPLTFFCRSCGYPMAIRVRMVPCAHMVCLTCGESAVEQSQTCGVCSQVPTGFEYLHPLDRPEVCLEPNCGEAFLNLRSLAYHREIIHRENPSDASPSDGGLRNYTDNRRNTPNTTTNSFCIPSGDTGDHLQAMMDNDSYAIPNINVARGPSSALPTSGLGAVFAAEDDDDLDLS